MIGCCAFRSGIQMSAWMPRRSPPTAPFVGSTGTGTTRGRAALLGNAEIAGGMYVFGVCGGDYTVVCKNRTTFLRPCLGPAVYRIRPQEDLNALVAAGAVQHHLEMDVVQQIGIPGKTDKRVGRAVVTFHVTRGLQSKRDRRIDPPRRPDPAPWRLSQGHRRTWTQLGGPSRSRAPVRWPDHTAAPRACAPGFGARGMWATPGRIAAKLRLSKIVPLNRVQDRGAARTLGVGMGATRGCAGGHRQ